MHDRSFGDWAFKPPHARLVKITALAAGAVLIFAKRRLAV
jgi:hypothetical protein